LREKADDHDALYTGRLEYEEKMRITGTIQKGAGQGAFFTQLPWVVEQFEKAMGFKPFPGTLNVRVADEDLLKLIVFCSKEDFEIIPSDPGYCSGRFKRIRVNGVPAALVFPEEHVHIHGKETLEIMAPFHIKEIFNLADGDQVTITDFDT
jgi:CTP-dependent riboflavin kinase